MIENKNPIVIKTENVEKSFGDYKAVDKLNLEVKKGEIVALLGSNGAGKTTVINMLLGLLMPSKGTVTVLDHDMSKFQYKVLHKLNLSSPYIDLPNRLKVKQNLTIYCYLYGVTNIKERILKLAGELKFESILEKRYGTLSSGQKAKVSLAKALVNQPEILFLDEPTSSLDPDVSDWVRSYIEKYRVGHKATILMASHDMAEVERLCDVVYMMKEGKIVDTGSPKDLIIKYGRKSLEEVFLAIARKDGDI